MDAAPRTIAAEAARLRRTLNNLITLMALPSLWSSGEGAKITNTLLDALVTMLGPAFVFARLGDPGGGAPLEITRVAESWSEAIPASEIGYAFDRASGESSPSSSSESSVVINGTRLRLASAPLGPGGALGVVAIASERHDFPSLTDQLILDVATNQTAIGLQQARLLAKERRIAADLDARVAARTADLAAMNEALQKEVAERRLAEAALRASERDLKFIIDTIPALAWSSPPDGIPDFFNRHFVNFIGLTAAPSADWEWTQAVHPDDAAGLVATWQRLLASETPGEAEARLRGRDGDYRWFLLRAHPLRNEQGRIVRWYGINTDIEGRKRAEEALTTARAELAHVARATSLSALTASIAHEVNQPLSGIVTNASTCLRMLDATPPDLDGARETARRTIRDGHRASDVIARLRALFSRKDVALESLDLNEATREVVALSMSELQRQRIVVQCELLPDLPSVIGDRIQLQQVILNLIRNAADAMVGIDDRARELVIATRRDEDDNVRLTVRDAGVGVGGQEPAQLFDAFYTTKSDGMGIGLSVSRSIVERHRGRLWCEPNEGPGATFAFRIPRDPEPVTGAAPAARFP